LEELVSFLQNWILEKEFSHHKDHHRQSLDESIPVAEPDNLREFG